tara:strand:- start:14686 stop:15825 length:1140 start_codon:yes stop_codon:yes gene_type:complete
MSSHKDNHMNVYIALINASLKMYFRNKQSLIWAMFFPLVLMVILGSYNFYRYTPPKIGVINLAQNVDSETLINYLKDQNTDNIVQFKYENKDINLKTQLINGDLSALITIPDDFILNNNPYEKIKFEFNNNKIEQSGIGFSILNNAINDLSSENNLPNKTSKQIIIEKKEINSINKKYRDFLVPGIISMAIMQGGIFGVVFTLIRFKSQGVLRRLQASPIGSSHFLVGQGLTRVIVSLLQTYVLIIAATFLLNVSIGKGIPLIITIINLSIVSIMGGVLFISMGLAISGWSKTEDTAAPMANLVTLPMMFLSGVFFPITSLPSWVKYFSEFLPLTFLSDALRQITLNGSNLIDITPQLTGLLIWIIITFILASRVFKWE